MTKAGETRLTRNLPRTNPELLALLERSKSVPFTREMYEAQRRSWVIGELMLEHEDMTREEAEALYDAPPHPTSKEG